MQAIDHLREFINGITLFDTHEHILPESDWVNCPPGRTDFTHFFSHYASVDLISAGMPPSELSEIRAANLTLDEKWSRFAPYWEKSRNTAYSQAVLKAIRDLFELPDLNQETYKELSRRMSEQKRTGWYRTVFKTKANIERAVVNLDNTTQVDPELFVSVYGFDQFIVLRCKEHLKTVQNETGFEISSISALTGALNQAFERRVHEKIVGIKISVAYQRSLSFEDPPRQRAEEVLAKILDGEKLSVANAKPLEDYMFHQVVQRAIEHHLPIQIHTGMQEGNGNFLVWSNPTLLSPVLMKYNKARFDLFHAGYPYCYELGVLAKMFPGVYPDLCWAHIITPQGTRRALSEWLELVPASKILAFGGDYLFIEGIYAHAMMARENVARVLAQKVDDNYFTLQEAESVARRILRENGKELFGV